MLVQRKKNIYFAIKLSLREIFSLCTRMRSFVHVNDVEIMCSRDAQCNTEESPKFLFCKNGAKLKLNSFKLR